MDLSLEVEVEKIGIVIRFFGLFFSVIEFILKVFATAQAQEVVRIVVADS